MLITTVLYAVSLAWDPSPDDRVSGYAVHSGLQSSNYNVRIDVGNVTQCTITNLTIGSTYYFVATAYTTNGLESLPSNEVSYTVPTAVSNVVYIGSRLEWWTNMSNINRQSFNVTYFENPPLNQFYRSYLILTNVPGITNVLFLRTRLEWWTNLLNVNKQMFDLMSLTNPPNPQFYRSYLIITNKPL